MTVSPREYKYTVDAAIKALRSAMSLSATDRTRLADELARGRDMLASIEGYGERARDARRKTGLAREVMRTDMRRRAP